MAVDGMRFTRRIMAAKALAKYRPEEFRPGPAIQSEQELEKAAGELGTTIFHPVGTCAMGSVVDERLRVRGVRQAARHRRLDHAAHHLGEHQRADHCDRRERRAHGAGGPLGLVLFCRQRFLRQRQVAQPEPALVVEQPSLGEGEALPGRHQLRQRPRQLRSQPPPGALHLVHQLRRMGRRTVQVQACAARRRRPPPRTPRSRRATGWAGVPGKTSLALAACSKFGTSPPVLCQCAGASEAAIGRRGGGRRGNLQGNLALQGGRWRACRRQAPGHRAT